MARHEKESSTRPSENQDGTKPVDWQALLDAARKVGRPLHFPPGRHRIDSTLVFPKHSADGDRESKAA